jgi:hypothetical protein
MVQGQGSMDMKIRDWDHKAISTFCQSEKEWVMGGE